MIPSDAVKAVSEAAVYQRGWMIDSQPGMKRVYQPCSISKGMDD